MRPLCLSLLATLLCGCGVGSGAWKNASGRQRFAAGNYAAAAGDFAQASMDNPSSPTYAYNLGRSLAKIGRHQEAEHHFRRALALDPRHQPTYHALAEMLSDTGRPDEAERLLTGWATTQPHLPAAHVELAAHKARNGDYATAETALRHAIAVDPSDPTPLAKLGEVYQQSGRTAEAARMYTASLHKNPFQQEVKGRLTALTAPPQSIRQAAGVPAPQMIAGRPNPAGLPQMSAYQPQLPFGVPPVTPAAMAFSPWRPTPNAVSPTVAQNYAPVAMGTAAFGASAPAGRTIQPAQWPTPAFQAAPQPQLAVQPAPQAVTPASGQPTGSIQPIHHETMSPPSWDEPPVVPAF